MKNLSAFRAIVIHGYNTSGPRKALGVLRDLMFDKFNLSHCIIVHLQDALTGLH